MIGSGLWIVKAPWAPAIIMKIDLHRFCISCTCMYPEGHDLWNMQVWYFISKNQPGVWTFRSTQAV